MFRRKDLVDDYREFTRELLLRFDRSQREHREALLARLDESQRQHREEVRQMLAEMRAEMREQSRKTDDLIAENRAQRQALFLLIDELRSGGGPATA